MVTPWMDDDSEPLQLPSHLTTTTRRRLKVFLQRRRSLKNFLHAVSRRVTKKEEIKLSVSHQQQQQQEAIDRINKSQPAHNCESSWKEIGGGHSYVNIVRHTRYIVWQSLHIPYLTLPFQSRRADHHPQVQLRVGWKNFFASFPLLLSMWVIWFVCGNNSPWCNWVRKNGFLFEVLPTLYSKSDLCLLISSICTHRQEHTSSKQNERPPAPSN